MNFRSILIAMMAIVLFLFPSCSRQELAKPELTPQEQIEHIHAVLPYEITDDYGTTIPCPVAYNFYRNGNAQTAVIKDYYFQFYESGTHRMFNIQIGTIETSLPAITYDGSFIQPTVASAICAQAARLAELQVAFVLNAFVISHPGTTPEQVSQIPYYKQMFKEVYREEINKFLRADYGYEETAKPATVSTSQMDFVLKYITKWEPLKFYGRDC